MRFFSQHNRWGKHTPAWRNQRLALNGVLFLDEMPEFSQVMFLEALRQPYWKIKIVTGG